MTRKHEEVEQEQEDEDQAGFARVQPPLTSCDNDDVTIVMVDGVGYEC